MSIYTEIEGNALLFSTPTRTLKVNRFLETKTTIFFCGVSVIGIKPSAFIADSML